jgi:hypothetical protein
MFLWFQRVAGSDQEPPQPPPLSTEDVSYGILLLPSVLADAHVICLTDGANLLP